MKKHLFLLAIASLSFVLQAAAQISSYSFSQTSDVYPSMTGATTLISGTSIDDQRFPVTLPFTFRFDNTDFSNIYVSANGFIAFGTTDPDYYHFPLSETSSGLRIAAAYGYNLMGLNASSDISVMTQGSAPNRVFIVQWKNLTYGLTTSGLLYNFQLHLKETSNIVEVVYGSMSTSLSYTNGEVGIRGNSYSSFNNRATSSSWTATSPGSSITSTVLFSPSCIPPSGLTFRWTPPPACTGPSSQPTALAFTSYTSAVYGSFSPSVPAASGYLVVRTPNVPMTSMPVNGTFYTAGSSLGGGTVVSTSGTSFTDAGLSPNTNYQYTVFAYNSSAACTGIGYNTTLPLIAGTSTTGPRKYTWVPASGSGSFITATNWSPARTYTDNGDTLIFDNGGSFAITDVPMTTIGGMTIANNTNVTMTSTVNDSIRIGTFFNIASGSLTLAGANTLKICFVTTGAAKTGTITGTLNMGGSCGYNATGSVTTVAGIINDSGANAAMTTYCGCQSSIVFTSTGFYIHARNGGNIPQATYAPASSMRITGVTNTAPVFIAGVDVGNLTWNCPSQNTRVNLSNLVAVLGDFRIQSTGSDTLVYSSGLGLNVGGEFAQIGGIYRITNGTGKLNVLGNVTLTGGVLDLTGNTVAATRAVNLLAYKNFVQLSAHSITKTGNSISGISFCGNEHQDVNVTGSIINSKIYYTLNNPAGATLTGTLPVNAGSSNTILNGSWTGTGAFGYNLTNDTLLYSGVNAITASTVEWPGVNAPAVVMLNMTGAGMANQLALPGTRTIESAIAVQKGILVLNDHNLVLNNTSTAMSTAGDTTGMIAADSTGYLVRTISVFSGSTAPTYLWPLGTTRSLKSYAPVYIDYSSNSTLRKVGIRNTDRKHPYDTSATNYVSKYFSVTDDGGSAPFTITFLSFYHDSSQIVGQPNFRMCSWDGTAWTQLPGIGTQTYINTKITTPLGGREFMGRPSVNQVYYWTGAVSKDYSVAGNWTPSRTTPSPTDALYFNDGNTDTVINVTGGEEVARLVFTNNTTAVWQSGVAVPSTNYTLRTYDSLSAALRIDSGSAFIINSTTYPLNIGFGIGGTSYGTIAGRLEVISTSAANNFSFTNSITTVTPAGVIAAGGSSTSGGGFYAMPSNLVINGTYEHKYTTQQGGLPNGTWAAGSLCLIKGYTTATSAPGITPTGESIVLRKLVYNCPAQTSALSWTGPPIAADSFIVVSTGTGKIQFGTSSFGYQLIMNNFLQTGGTVDVTNGVMNISGTLLQQGGTFLTSATGTNTGTIHFNGTLAQNVSFRDAAPAGRMVYRVANPSGINLTGTGALTASFAINNGGGMRISTANPHPVTTSLALLYDTTGATLTYDTTAGIPSADMMADATVFPADNGPANLTVNIGSASTVTLPFSRTIPGTLTMVNGDVAIGSNTLTIGKSAASAGTIVWTGGYITPTTGSVVRWYSTSGLPTAPGTSIGYYPVKIGGAQRSVSLYFSTSVALAAGGTIGLSLSATPGITSGISIPDGTETLTFRNNSSWTFSAGGGISLSGTMGARLTGGGLYTFIDPTKLHMMHATSVAGTHVPGAGTSPNFTVARSTLSIDQLTAEPFYIGAQDTTYGTGSIFISVADGDWNTGTTWNLGTVPGTTATVFIANNKTVTLNTVTNTAKVLTVYPGSTLAGISGARLSVDSVINNNGTIAITGDTIKLGPAGGGKRTFTNTGSLSLTAGSLFINGNISLANGCSYVQSGGNMVIDGNAAGVVANSVASGTPLLNIGICTVSATGGNIIFIDPHTAYTTALFNTTAVSPGFSGTHSTVFGDGISGTPGTTNGFYVQCLTPLNNIVVNGSIIGSNRNAELASDITVKGNISLSGTNAEFSDNGKIIHLWGNLLADTYTKFDMYGELEFANPAAAQSVGGTGIYRNTTSSPTANFSKLTLRNGSAAGVIFNIPDPSFATGITFYSGNIHVTTGALVNVNNVAVYTPGQATGWVAAKYRIALPGTGNYNLTFPVGDDNYYAPVKVTIPSGNVLSPGALTASTTSGDHAAIGSSLIMPMHSINRVYRIDTSGGIKLASLGSAATVFWNAADADPGISWPMLGAAGYRSGVWANEPITIAPPSSVTINTLGSDIAGDYAVGMLATSPFFSSQPSDKSICQGTNTTFSVGAAAGSLYQWQVNSGTGWANAANGALYSNVTTATLTISAAPSSINGYTFRCRVYTAPDTLYTIAASLAVNNLASPITAPSMAVCAGNTISLSNASPGGTWSNGSATVCTIDNTSGIVSGLSAGTALISYTLSTGCRATAIVTVNSSPADITGTFSVCVAATTTLASATTGGTWTSSNSSIATAGTGSGIITGVAAGTTNVSYIISSTGCQATAIVTVGALPAGITGTAELCAGSATTLSDITTGGTWSSANVAIASATTTTGIITGITAGTTNISYTAPNGCSRVATVTVDALPSAITGPYTVCRASTVSLSSATPGGVWSSSAIAIATVSSSGVVLGYAAGTAAVSYMLPTGCYVTATITVNPLPASVTGTAEICAGAITTLGDISAGGTWSTSAGGIATVEVVSGIVNGIVSGTAIITYMLPTGCSATRIVTVDGLPAAIAGTASVCVGSITSLSSATPGASWSSSDPGIGTVSSSGSVTGIAPGTTVISYRLSTGCVSTAVVTVDPLPAAISGVAAVCTGASVTLADATTGGNWSCSATAVLTADASTGTISGISVGTAPVSYILPTGCYRTITATVNASPAPVTGSTLLCSNATTTLSDPSAGGTWQSSTAAIATVAATTGIVSGVSVGTTIISYVMGTGCYDTVTVTVNAAPAAITGTASVCNGSVTILTDLTPGGTWTSSNPSIASVLPATGNVSGLAGGVATISYTLSSNACFVTREITVDVVPAIVVTGADYVCIGTPATYVSSATGGMWNSSNTAIASVSSTGVVTGNIPGTVSISYTKTNACGNFSASKDILVYTAYQCDSVLSAPTVTAATSQVELFPNPSAGSFTVIVHDAVTKEITITITNMLGKQVWNGQCTTNTPINVTVDFPSGIYLLNAGAGHERTIRFVLTGKQ